ncbi:MAG: DUF6360 family protein [Halolamina sp.]
MADRILKVNAYTTLDLADGEVRTNEETESAPAVVNATAPRKEPDHVELAVELDNTVIESVPPHADRIELSPAEARQLAGDLEKHAARVETTADDGDGD